MIIVKLIAVIILLDGMWGYQNTFGAKVCRSHLELLTLEKVSLVLDAVQVRVSEVSLRDYPMLNLVGGVIRSFNLFRQLLICSLPLEVSKSQFLERLGRGRVLVIG